MRAGDKVITGRSPDNMLDALEALLRELGDMLLEWRGRGATGGRWEGTQFKARADRQAHDFLSDRLAAFQPALPVVSEEDEARAGRRPEEYWLIDPIDGTASFCQGFDGFVTQAALMRRCEPILAVVHAAALGLTYTALRDGRARCNGVPISTSAPARRAPILTDNYPEPRGVARDVYDAIGCGGYVESGSIGLKICRVADATADLFVKDVIVRDWDLAPAHLILERAGGVLTTLAGDPIPYDGGFERAGLIAAAHGSLARQVRDCNKAKRNE